MNRWWIIITVILIFFGIGSDGILYEDMWDWYPTLGWLGSMKKVGLTQIGDAALFGTVDPGNNQTVLLRIFVGCSNGTLFQATRTFTQRRTFLTWSNWIAVTGVNLNGPYFCRRPSGYSNAGTVTLFSIGIDGVLSTISFSAV